MGCKYVILFESNKDFKLQEGEKEIEKAIAVLLPSKIKTDPQAIRKFKKMRSGLEHRAKKNHQIRLCRILW